MRRLLCLLLAVIVLAPMPVDAQYLKYLNLGKQQQKEGKHDEAVKSFRKALEYEVKPGAQYFMALSFISLKRYVEAKQLLLAVQRHPATPSVVKDIIPSKLAAVELELQRLASIRVTLVVTTPRVKGATVLLDGRAVGSTPWSQQLKPGTLQLTVRKEGYQDHVERLTLSSTQTSVRRLVTLVALPQLIKVEAPGFNGAKVFLDGKLVGLAPVSIKRAPKVYRLRVALSGYKSHTEDIDLKVGEPVVRTVALLALPKKTSTFRIVAYVTGAVGIAGLAAAGAFHALAIKSRNAANDPANTQQTAISKFNKSKTQMNVAYAMYGVGGASLAAAITFLVLDLTRKPVERNVMVVPNQLGASVFVRF